MLNSTESSFTRIYSLKSLRNFVLVVVFRDCSSRVLEKFGALFCGNRE
jgi:hypothetical protein